MHCKVIDINMYYNRYCVIFLLISNKFSFLSNEYDFKNI